LNIFCSDNFVPETCLRSNTVVTDRKELTQTMGGIFAEHWKKGEKKKENN
jgi:hypothetical protein